MIELLIWIVIIGLIVFLVNRYAPIPQGFKTLIYVVCIIWAILLVLNTFGFTLGSVPAPRVK